jgi:predicted nucleotidyltransferase
MYNICVKNLEKLKLIIRENEQTLKNDFKIKKIAIFGSFARGEQKKNSDIDILVEFSEPVGFEFFRASRYLEKILGIKVDLVTKDAIKPQLAKTINRDLMYV